MTTRLCTPCGGMGQPCCANNACTGATLGCDRQNNTCTLCGAANQPCCANNTCTTAGLSCRGDTCR
jgi:hypothetical protein